MVEALQRIHKTETQTQLSRWERFENTSNEFSIVNTLEIEGRSVLLIDDIITTGATMAGSAVPLWENGAERIIVGAIGLTQRL
jgi:predicted amidophosphoribosyltransferase